jgi:hypothetical protein
MSRAGCCCGGGPNPGNCCEPDYSQTGRRYTFTADIGPWPGLGTNGDVSYGAGNFGVTCYDSSGLPCGTQSNLCFASVTNATQYTWGGGNGTTVFQPVLSPLEPQCTSCDNGGGGNWVSIANIVTTSLVPDGKVSGTLTFVGPNGSTPVTCTWLSGDLTILSTPAVSAQIKRSGGANVEVGCYNDALCSNGTGLALIVTAQLPTRVDMPCDPFGLSGPDFPVQAIALYYGCQDSDDRYQNETRYATRTFILNRVDDCGAVGSAIVFDAVTPTFGTGQIYQVQMYRPLSALGPFPCAPDPTYPILTADIGGCAGSSYVVTVKTDIPDQCPFKAGWWDPDMVPHPFPEVIKVVRQNPPAPTITTSAPGSGPAAGGTSLTISGTNFIQVTDVLVGGTRVPSLIGNSATSITINTPPGTAGTTVAITVVTDGGSATRPNAFTYT